MTQADVDSGSVENSATAEGTPPGGGDPVPSPPSETNTPTPAAEAGIVVTKSAELADEDGDDLADVGEEIEYSFEVTNTGNVTMTDVAVQDPKVTGLECAETTLAPGESTTCSAESYTVTRDDIDSGSVTNTASAIGTPPGGGDPVHGPEVTVELPVEEKTDPTDPTDPDEPGDPGDSPGATPPTRGPETPPVSVPTGQAPLDSGALRALGLLLVAVGAVVTVASMRRRGHGRV